MKDLSERLRWVREKAGLSTKGLDAVAGLTKGHTSAIERRERLDPSMSTLRKLAAALGVSLDWLILGRGTAPTVTRLRASISARLRSRLESAVS